MLLDHGPGDLVVALSRGLHRVPCHVVERNRVGENAHRLVEGTEPEETDTQQVRSMSHRWVGSDQSCTAFTFSPGCSACIWILVSD